MPATLAGFLASPLGSIMPSGPASTPAGWSCGDRLMQYHFLDLVALPTDRAITILGGQLGAGQWVGAEYIAAYRPGDAAATMRELRRVAAGCSSFDASSVVDLSGTVTAQTGPALGDDSVVLTIRSRSQFGSADEDTLVIRAGDYLVVVTRTPGYGGTPSDLTTVGSAAMEVFK